MRECKIKCVSRQTADLRTFFEEVLYSKNRKGRDSTWKQKRASTSKLAE